MKAPWKTEKAVSKRRRTSESAKVKRLQVVGRYWTMSTGTSFKLDGGEALGGVFYPRRRGPSYLVFAESLVSVPAVLASCARPLQSPGEGPLSSLSQSSRASR